MAEELAHWIIGSGQRATDPAALQAIALFAGESATMRLARDDVRVEWFPPGVYVTEQGEPAHALYLILNGTADALWEQPGGQMTPLSRMHAGDFFGELGLVAGERAAHFVARGSLTCLVLSRPPATPYSGAAPAPPAQPNSPPPPCRRGPAQWTSPATFTANSKRWHGTAPTAAHHAVPSRAAQRRSRPHH
jgi:hypothetical protein